jgi:hypothetical protein
MFILCAIAFGYSLNYVLLLIKYGTMGIYINQQIFCLIIYPILMLYIIFFNYYLWRSLKPLTPAELAEGKRIRAERKKAKLQSKIDKLQ